MADPLSSVASVIVIAGCVAESSVFLLGLFRRAGQVPGDIRQLLLALESLHLTLTNV